MSIQTQPDSIKSVPVPLSDTQRLLNALYAADTSVPFPLFDAQGQPVEYDPAREGMLYAQPLTEGGVAFLFGGEEDAQPDAWKSASVRPTAVMEKYGTQLLCWALDALAEADSVADIAVALGMESVDELVPLPGTNDWMLIHCDGECFCSAGDLRAAYVLGEAHKPSALKPYPDERDSSLNVYPAGSSYADAIVKREYREADYPNEVTCSFAGKGDSQNWEPRTEPLGALIAHLSKHAQRKKKGGLSIVGGELAGKKRLQRSVKAIHLIGLDIDNGVQGCVVDAAVEKLGVCAIKYSTHSHRLNRTDINRDTLVERYGEITDTSVQNYLREVKKWEHAIAKTAMVVDDAKHTHDRGIVVEVAHDPVEKWRILIPLAAPFVIADAATTQKKALDLWATLPEKLAQKMGLPFDASCRDAARCYFLPSHAEGAEFEISLWGGINGALFDWRTLIDPSYPTDALDKLAHEFGNGERKTKTKEGIALTKWSVKGAAGLQIADLIEDHAPDRMRGKESGGTIIECPFASHHSDPDDPDDKACLAINAGEGHSPIFTVKCLHNGCREYTHLDHLGKMIVDGWFEREVLDDQQYQAEVVEEGTPSLKDGKQGNKTRQTLESLMDSLNPNTTDDELEILFQAMIDADCSQRAVGKMLNEVKQKAGGSLSEFRAVYRKIKARANKDTTGAHRNENGVWIVPYSGRPDFHEVCEVVKHAMLKRNEEAGYPRLCAFDGAIVEMDLESPGGRFFEPVSRESFWSACNTLVRLEHHGENGPDRQDKVGEDNARYVYELAKKWLRQKPEFCDTPRLLPSGELIATEGYHYDPTNGINHYLKFKLGERFRIPQNPTREEAEKSLRWIQKELLSDFSFCDTDKEKVEGPAIGEAHTLALFLTPFMRPLFNGQSPIFLISKATPGEGATLLAEMAGTLFAGIPPDVINYTSNDDELQKLLLATAIEGKGHLFFDDVTSPNSKLLHRGLTSPTLAGRVLGETKVVSVPNRFVWMMSGINPTLTAETRRRVLPIRLNSKNPTPGERQFQHPDISGLTMAEFIAENRSLAVSHILTIIRFWVVNGKPILTDRKLPSFVDWSRKVGGLLALFNVGGFLQQDTTRAYDPEAAAHDEFALNSVIKFGVDVAIPFLELFNYHDGRDAPILSGKHEYEREKHFRGLMARMTDKTFRLNLGKAGGEIYVILKREFSATADDTITFRKVDAPK